MLLHSVRGCVIFRCNICNLFAVYSILMVMMLMLLTSLKSFRLPKLLTQSAFSYWAFLGSGSFWVFRVCLCPSRSFWALLGLTWLYWALLSLIQPYWALLVCLLALLGFIGP